MAPYNTYGNYYDPVGSQSTQPQGYTHANQQQQQQQQTTPASSNSQYPTQTGTNYQSNYGQNYNAGYETQPYGTTPQQPQAQAQSQVTSTANRAASALGAMSSQNYAQPASDARSSNTAQYDSSYYSSAGYAAMNSRSQSNESPLYASSPSDSTFGRLSLPTQSQPASNPFGTSQNYQASASNASTQSYQNAPSSARSSHRKYQTAYTQPQTQQQPPQRYASPLQAVQAQHHQQGHNKQSSRASNHAPPPQMAARNAQQQHIQQQHQRQTSASVEPSPTTVNPSQVYDMRAEQQRKAQVDAEKRRKADAQRKAEEQARAAEEATKKAEEHRKSEAERIEREACEAREVEEAAKAEEEAAKKKAAQERRNELRRKAREEKKQSKTAATALTQMASAQVGPPSSSGMAMASMSGVGDMSQPPANAEEAEMRAMFKKMREFNARNPDLLSKLWEEERTAHASTPPTNTTNTSQTPAPAPASIPPKQQVARQNATPTTTPSQKANQQTRPFKQPIPAKTAPPPVVAPVQQTNAQLWPTDQKGPIAETATIWLNNYPRNQASGKMVRKDEIHRLLDANPSYVQLCESLEAQGVKLDRSLFAKELLKAMPKDSRNSQSSSKAGASASAPAPGITAQMNGAAAPNEPAKKNKGGRPRKDGPLTYSVPQYHTNRSSAGGVAYSAPSFTSLADAARAVNEMNFPSNAPATLASAITGSNSPFGTPAQTPAIGEASGSMSRPPSQSQATDVKSESVPPEPQRPPADKEEAARKRTFNDLVDLTKADSDDEAPPRKIQQTSSGLATDAIKPPPLHDYMGRPINPMSYIRQPPHFLNSMPGQGAFTPPTKPNAWTNPTRPPVPQPPVVPSQPQARPKGPTEEQKQQERLRGKMLVEPIMRDRVARKSRYDSRTIARDVLLATGRHPDMRSLNAHLNSMQKILGDHGGVVDNAGNKSDLATIRWDIVDPGEPAEEAKSQIKTAAASRGEEYVQSTSSAAAAAAVAEETEDADDESDEASARATSTVDRQAHLEKRLNKFREIATDEELLNVDDERVLKLLSVRLKQREKERRKESAKASGAPRGPGRRPKARPSAVASSTSDNNFTLETDITPRILNNNKTRATPAKSTPASKGSAGSPMSGAIGYAAFRQYDADGNEIKRKGRPVGWRKSIHSREAQGLQPATSNKAASPGSRVRKAKDAGKGDYLVKAQYQVYKCCWQGCTSELDNLERLKKHMVKLHGMPNADGDFECRWPNCQSAGKHVDANGRIRQGDAGVSSFEGIEHWLKHIQKAHLEEVAWKLGDGPKGGSVSDQHTDTESYLSDAQGRSVTPIILPASEQLKNDSTGLPNLTPGLPKLKGPGRPSTVAGFGGGPMSKEERDAAGEIQRLVDRKRLEGPTMGQEGCKLAVEQRRRGFLDDEDFEDIMSEDDTW